MAVLDERSYWICIFFGCRRRLEKPLLASTQKKKPDSILPSEGVAHGI
jgi:hypothetical protein